MINYKKCPCCDSENISLISTKSFFKTEVYNCKNCNLHYNDMSDPNSIDFLEKYYSTQYWHLKENKPKSFLRSFLSKIPWLKFELLRADSQFKYLQNYNGTVLDVGAGGGYTSKYFASKGFVVHALEPDLKNLQNLNKFGIQTYQSNFENIHLTKKFDIIILSHVLEHILDIEEFLKSLKMILSRKGILFIEIPNCSTDFDLNHSIKENPHLSHFTKKSMEYLCQKINFEIVKFDQMYFHNDITLFQHGLQFLKFKLFKTNIYHNGVAKNDNVFRVLLKLKTE